MQGRDAGFQLHALAAQPLLMRAVIDAASGAGSHQPAKC